jgi:hypothetical protein
MACFLYENKQEVDGDNFANFFLGRRIKQQQQRED